MFIALIEWIGSTLDSYKDSSYVPWPTVLIYQAWWPWCKDLGVSSPSPPIILRANLRFIKLLYALPYICLNTWTIKMVVSSEQFTCLLLHNMKVSYVTWSIWNKSWSLYIMYIHYIYRHCFSTINMETNKTSRGFPGNEAIGVCEAIGSETITQPTWHKITPFSLTCWLCLLDIQTSP